MSEIHPALTITPDAKLGPAMRNLNERQQAFVTAMIEMGGINHARAALAAGYGNGKLESATVQGHRLAHDADILAAIREEADRRLRSGSVMCVQTLLEIANSQGAENKDRLKAVEMILNRAGLHAVTEHNVKVEHRDATDEGMIKRIKLLAEKQGLDPIKLLGNAGMVVDAEFKEIIPAQAAENTEREQIREHNEKTEHVVTELTHEAEAMGLYKPDPDTQGIAEDDLADIF